MKNILFSLIILFTQNIFANEWRHVSLRSREGVAIQIDYLMANQCHRYEKNRATYEARMANPVWINVYGLPPSQIQVDVEFYIQDMILHGGGENPIYKSYDHYDRVVQLNYDPVNKRHTGNIGVVATRVTSGSSRIMQKVYQKLRFWVNGRILIDPISTHSQFQVSFYDTLACY